MHEKPYQTHFWMFKTTYGKPQLFVQSDKCKTKCSFVSLFMHEEEIKTEEI